MDAGQSANDEMEDGVRNCAVFVLFLDSVYPTRPNCLREWDAAKRQAKHVTVVLLEADCCKRIDELAHAKQLELQEASLALLASQQSGAHTPVRRSTSSVARISSVCQ